jgi:hypothetical protein
VKTTRESAHSSNPPLAARFRMSRYNIADGNINGIDPGQDMGSILNEAM